MAEVAVVLVKVPQEPVGAQEKVTPALVVSFVRDTVTGSIADLARDAGIVEVKLIVMAGPVLLMVILAVADLVVSLTEVAVMVAPPPVGGVAGAL